MPRIVACWRSRFLEKGLDGLIKDAPRSGRKPSLTDEKVQRIVRRTIEQTPRHATHLSTRSMAKAEGVSEKAVWRIWKRHGLKPHLVRTFKLSHGSSSRLVLFQGQTGLGSIPVTTSGTPKSVTIAA